ncbi:hypothetical protein BB560_007057 [Smittium megazygosporum]|uniref:Uncharacterized protein n=1 Tax=Smittium megazygosporum TaxID=133381 RepID=A0A2T9XZ53_9FUNG|nr:hypothetical protein BB560_007057 [Smittium megazygosporum]
MRNARKRKTPAKPISSEYFVGYVEDDESVEAIMKKFQELENIEKEFSEKKPTPSEQAQNDTAETSISSVSQSSLIKDPSEADSNNTNQSDVSGFSTVTPTAENQMSPEFLAEVFKRTSAFTVKSALMDQDELEILDDVDLWKAEIGYLSEYESQEEYLDVNDDFWDEDFGFSRSGKSKGKKKSSKSYGSSGSRLSLRDQIIQRYKYMQVHVKDKAGRVYIVNRKVTTVNPLLPTYIRIPPYPIPNAWAKPISHYSPMEYNNFSSKEVSCILSLKWPTNNKYQAIYMDPPLKYIKSVPTDENSPNISKIPVNKMLAPGGFVFVWCEKEFMPELFTIAETVWGLRYVENFCWVKKNTNNQISKQPSKYFCRSKVTCFIFRALGDLEMRHQRSPDCVFDFIKSDSNGLESLEKPEFVYKVIETLLPESISPNIKQDGSLLLNLWAPNDYNRSNWEMISEL